MGADGSDHGGAAPDADEALLDALLDRLVRDVSDGREIDAAALLPGRPDLAARVAELIDVAKEIAPRRPPERPVFAGYEILRELGRGGMGQVLLARHRKLGRTVALKVLPRRLASGRARERFEREARAVARLQHPLVVPIYDLGEEDGQSYFTMSFVEGATLAAAIAAVRGRDAASLTGADLAGAAGAGVCPERWAGPWWRAALQSAIDVADALAAAHRAGIVHRDVKPSNVMLRRDGFALLFDFGLAAVEDEATLTLTQGFVGTPHYASPEQAAGETASLDARSDVFSLAATLYEAVTLRLPFPGPTTHEILRRIQTWEPETPSAANPSLPKDLDTVILAGLEKDRARRYASVEAFAEDLRAVAAGRKIRAKRAGLIERGLRSMKRGRALTDLLVEQQARNAELRGLVLRAEREEAAARAAQAAAEEERRRADEAANRALAESARVRTALSFLEEALTSADPTVSGRDVRVADVLAKAAERAAKTLAGDPVLRLSVERAIVSTIVGLGLFKEAEPLARDGHARAERTLAPDDPLRVEWDAALGRLLWALGEFRACLPLFEQVHAARVRALGAGHETSIIALCDYGQVLGDAGRAQEAEATLRRALDLALSTLGPEHEASLFGMHNLGFLLANSKRFDEGVSLLARAAAGRRRTVGTAHPDTIISESMVGQSLKEAGRPADAEPYLRRATEWASAALGPDHPESLAPEHNLCGALLELGRIDEALSRQRRVTECCVRTLGAGSSFGRYALLQLARILARAGGPRAELEAAVREAIDAWRAVEGDDGPNGRDLAALLTPPGSDPG